MFVSKLVFKQKFCCFGKEKNLCNLFGIFKNKQSFQGEDENQCKELCDKYLRQNNKNYSDKHSISHYMFTDVFDKLNVQPRFVAQQWLKWW